MEYREKPENLHQESKTPVHGAVSREVKDVERELSQVVEKILEIQNPTKRSADDEQRWIKLREKEAELNKELNKLKY